MEVASFLAGVASFVELTNFESAGAVQLAEEVFQNYSTLTFGAVNAETNAGE
jgi:hypothetical protein